MINFLKRFKYLTVIFVAILAILIFTLALWLPSSGDGQSSINISKKSTVKTELVSKISSSFARQNIIGTVQSLSEVDLRAERAGTITQVYKKSGESVVAGAVIASISNAQEAAGVQAARAEIESAEARVAQATATLKKVKGGTRVQQLAILSNSTAGAQSTLSEAITSAKNALSSAYVTVDSGVVRGTDGAFVNADSANPHAKFETTNYAKKILASNQRLALSEAIKRQQSAAQNVHGIATIDELKIELTTTEADLRNVKTFLDTLLIALDGGIATGGTSETILISYKATAEGARTGVLGAMSSISGARSALSGAAAAAQIANENESLGITGAQVEDVEAAEATLALAKAGLSRARAGLASAVAVYEKTLVRTAISGTLTTLSVDRGDFVNMYQQVGVVANNGTIEVLAYISKEDADSVMVGTEAIVEDKYKSIVSSVASGLDPLLHQVQVRITLLDSADDILNGESVSVEILQGIQNKEQAKTTRIKIPLAAVKFEAGRVVVFTISEDAKLVVNEVTLGSIAGDLVIVENGIGQTMKIVLDARGLYEGQDVIVK